jgi:hypothetical protein
MAPPDDDGVWPSSPEPQTTESSHQLDESTPTNGIPEPGKDAPSYANVAKLKGVGVRRGAAGGNKQLDNIVEDHATGKD